jgi:transposase
MDMSALVVGARKNNRIRNDSKELRGAILEVLKVLLEERRDDEILELVSKLVARNEELEKLLATIRANKNRGEKVSRDKLKQLLEKLAREQPDDEKLQKANEELNKATTDNAGRPEQPKPPNQPPVRRPAPPGLRRVDNPIAVPAEQRPCPICGTDRKTVDIDVREVIELIPAEVIVRLDQREVLSCPTCEGEMVRAPMGDKVVTGGAYGSRLVGSLVVDKYWHGLPLTRIAQDLEMLGLSMPSSSMSDQIMWATDLLQPICRALIAQVLGATIMHMDSTSIPVRDKETGYQVNLGALWGYVGDKDCAVYLYASTGKKLGQREGEVGPEEFLAHRTGYVVVDASNLFDKSFQSDRLIEVGCNMHGRRRFVQALEGGDERAAYAVAAFQTLYDVEDCVRDADAETRQKQRQARSKPVYEALIAWCGVWKNQVEPSSLLGKAIQYLDNHKVELTRFVDDGRVPIDNGIVERLHRGPAKGRRSYLFAGSHAGGQRAAIAYSVLATCALLGVNPVDYLADVLPKLARGVAVPHDIPALMPAAWKAARAAAQAPAQP